MASASTTKPDGGCSTPQILIVNHALFFTDLALRREQASILPRYETVILDEAHTIEAAAGEYLGRKVTSGQVDYALRRLYNDRTNRGLLVHHKLREAQQEVDECRWRASDLFDSLARWIDERPGGNGRVMQPDIVSNPLDARLRNLVAALRRHAHDIEQPEQRMDFTAAANRLDALGRGIADWLGQEMADSVYWLDRRGGRSRLRVELAAAPIDVGPILREHLFDQVPTVVMTSATLAHGRRGRRAVVRVFSRPHRIDAGRRAVAGQPVRLSAAGDACAAGRHARPRRRGPRDSSGQASR